MNIQKQFLPDLYFLLNCVTVDTVNVFDLHVFISGYIYRDLKGFLSLLLSKYFTDCVII